MKTRLNNLKKARYYVGQAMLAILTMGIFTRFVTSGDANTVKLISNVLLRVSFILFSTNLMITIGIQNIQLKSKSVHSSIYREEKRKRAA